MECIAVVDYGMGNLRSVSKALEHVATPDQQVVVTASAEVLGNADRVVFPGQGAIRHCMAEIHRLGLHDALMEALANKPFLGICIGQQALLENSEEDADTHGLGVFHGTVKRFPDGMKDPINGERLKIPHMGWNEVRHDGTHPLWKDIADGERFYFVHSYYVAPEDPAVILGSTHYGLEFASAVARDNLFAMQFHPEKSQHAGLALLGNFLRWQVT